ncbi:MAG TPA: hypothetical protein VF721_03320 [Pyrinomonadaceae bacterium]|jgi:hypothetical protein
MKNFIAVLIFGFAFLACSKSEKFNNSAGSEESDAPVILEITQDAVGMWDVTGKTLFLKLRGDGFVEFEFPDDKKKSTGKINKAEDLNTLYWTKLGAEELKAFADLLKSEDFQQTGNEYRRKCCCTDAVLNYKINFQDAALSKNISLNGYCGSAELTSSRDSDINNLPKVLSGLMRLAILSGFKTHFPKNLPNSSNKS